MTKKYLPYYYSFNEKVLAAELISLKNNKITATINAAIRNNTFNYILSLVVRYLLHEKNLSPLIVRNCIRKYAVIISYMYICSCNNIDMKGIKNDKIKNIIDNMSVETLTSDINIKGLYGKLFNDEDYNKSLNRLMNKLKNQGKEKIKEDVYSLLRGEFNYFSPNTKLTIFSDNKSMRRFDLIVAEGLVMEEFTSFNIEFDYESFITNIDNKLENKNIRMAMIFVGYLIHHAIVTNNLNFKSKPYIIPNNKFVICCTDKDASINNTGLIFMSLTDKKNKIYEFDINKVEYFEFTYNQNKYQFTKTGIKMLT
jgi:hypothetical protein